MSPAPQTDSQLASPPQAAPKPVPVTQAQLEPLLRAMMSEDEALRKNTWPELRELGAPAVPILLRMAASENTDPDLRSAAAAIVSYRPFASAEALPVLVSVLSSSAPGVTASALRSIARLGLQGFRSDAALTAALEFISNTDDERRIAVVRVIDAYGKEVAQAQLLGLSKDPNVAVRAEAAAALTRRWEKSTPAVKEAARIVPPDLARSWKTASTAFWCP